MTHPSCLFKSWCVFLLVCAAVTSAGDTAPVDVPVARHYRDGAERFRLFTYEGEVFTAGETADGGTVLVNSDGLWTVRRFYDDAARLVKRELWSLGETVAATTLTTTERFFYVAAAATPAYSRLLSETTFTETEYDAAGRRTRVRVARIEPHGEIDMDELLPARQVPESSRSWRYTDDGAVLEQVYEQYATDMRTPLFVRRETYDYHAATDVPPDYTCYEDGELRIRTLYQTKDDYETTVYFDGGYTVAETYARGKKVSDAIMLQGRIIQHHDYAE
ncbi:MAG: hypothetical protein IJ191_03555 [Treponema sp.]|nr:hypothetical protein [Treponema sp.]